MDQHIDPDELQPFDGSPSVDSQPRYRDAPDATDSYDRQPAAYRDDPEGVHDMPPLPPLHGAMDITSPYKSESTFEACLMLWIRRKKLMAGVSVVVMSLLITYIVLMTKGDTSSESDVVGDPHGHGKDVHGNYLDPRDDPQQNPAAFEMRVPHPPNATNRVHHIRRQNSFQHFCNRTLDSEALYYLTEDIVCNSNYGPILSTNTYLDCQGFSIIAGPNSKLKAVGITVPSSASSVTIMNCGVTNYDIGMQLDGASSFVQNSEAFDNRLHGIVTSGNNNLIQCTAARNNKKNGIYTISGGLLTISGCFIESNMYGITMSSGVDAVCSLIRNNNVGVMVPYYTNAENRMSDDVLVQNSLFNLKFDNTEGALRLNRVTACHAGTDLGNIANSDIIVKAELTCDTMSGEGSGNFTCDYPCPPLVPANPEEMTVDWAVKASAAWALSSDKCQDACEYVGRFTPSEIST